MKTLCQIANLQHTGTGFIGNAYLLRLYGPIKVALHTNLGRGLTNRAFLISALSTPSGALSTLSYSLRGFGCRHFLVRGFSCHRTITVFGLFDVARTEPLARTEVLKVHAGGAVRAMSD